MTHGIWALGPNVSANLLPEYLTAPYPAYISLWSALYLHSMIDQVPNRIFVASLSRAREVRTSVGTFAIHHWVASKKMRTVVTEAFRYLRTQPDRRKWEVIE